MSTVYLHRLFDKKGHCWQKMAQHMSILKKKGLWLFRGFVGDDIVPSYVGIISYAIIFQDPVIKQSLPLNNHFLKPSRFHLECIHLSDKQYFFDGSRASKGDSNSEPDITLITSESKAICWNSKRVETQDVGENSWDRCLVWSRMAGGMKQ